MNVQIMGFTCCLNIGFNLTILKMSKCHFVGPELDPNCLTLMISLKEFLEKDDSRQHIDESLPSMQRVESTNWKVNLRLIVGG